MIHLEREGYVPVLTLEGAERANPREEFSSRGTILTSIMNWPSQIHLWRWVNYNHSGEKAGLNLLHIPVTDKGKDHLGYIFHPKHFSALFLFPKV